MIFGLFGKKKKTFPVLLADSIKPSDSPVTTAECKQIFRDWMKRIGYFDDPDELRQYVADISGDIHGEMEVLRADLDVYKEELKGAKDQVKEIKTKLRSASDEDKEELESELEDALGIVESAEKDFAEQKKMIADFKADKREYIVRYINDLTQRKD